MRLVIWRDMQFDADALPPFVVASECIPAADYWAGRTSPKAKVEPVEPVEPLEPPRAKRARGSRG